MKGDDGINAWMLNRHSWCGWSAKRLRRDNGVMWIKARADTVSQPTSISNSFLVCWLSGSLVSMCVFLSKCIYECQWTMCAYLARVCRSARIYKFVCLFVCGPLHGWVTVSALTVVVCWPVSCRRGGDAGNVGGCPRSKPAFVSQRVQRRKKMQFVNKSARKQSQSFAGPVYIRPQNDESKEDLVLASVYTFLSIDRSKYLNYYYGWWIDSVYRGRRIVAMKGISIRSHAGKDRKHDLKD